MIRNYLWLPCMAILLCGTLGMGSNKGASSGPLSLEGLHALCGLPAACDVPTPWEGQAVSLWGRLDPQNIFDKKHYPQLPYEKFRLIDGQGRSVEVWAVGRDNQAIFDKLARRSSEQIVVQGRLAAIKMPAAGDCRTGVKVEIDDARQVTFKSK